MEKRLVEKCLDIFKEFLKVNGLDKGLLDVNIDYLRKKLTEIESQSKL